MKSKAVRILVIAILGLGVGAIGHLLFHNYVNNLKQSAKSEVTVEYGSQITLDLFFDEVPEKTSFITNVSQIDTSIPQSYQISINNHGYVTRSVLNVVDSTPPTGEAVPQRIYLNQLPDPRKCVKNVEDLTEVTIDFADDVDASYGGERNFGVVLTDLYGNERTIEVPFEVMDDHDAPNIKGAYDIVIKKIPDNAEEIEVNLMEGVTVVDNFDKTPHCEVDDSEVEYDVVGTYPITYSLSDECGNYRTHVANVYVVKSNTTKSPAPEGIPVRWIDVKVTKTSAPKTENKKQTYDDPFENVKVSVADPKSGNAETAHAAARKILAKITNDKMSKEEKAFKIVLWVHRNIGFTHKTKFHNWAQEATYAFKYRKGSCFASYACCKALFDVAGIPNMQVRRSPVRSSKHFWNLVYLNNGWYHCDATKWSGTSSYIFMMTDKEVAKAKGAHRFKKSNYPKRSTISVQRYLNYGNATIKKGMPKPTDTPSPTPGPTNTTAPTSAATATPIPTKAVNPTVTPVSEATPKPEATATPKPTNTPVPEEPAENNEG